MEKSEWVVLKFGGTSVASLECWKKIREIVKKRRDDGKRVIVICSAVAGISDKLEELLDKSISGNYDEVIRFIEKRHRALANDLEVDFGVIDGFLEELKRIVTGTSLIKEISPRIKAKVLAYGELISTKLGAAYLGKSGLSASWLDARDYMMAEERHELGEKRSILSASCCSERDVNFSKEFCRTNRGIQVTQGFIARNKVGDTVLLGRGGSDVSAAYFAAKIGASRCEIWTDVPGMYTANPHQVPEARLIKYLTYDEAQEIATTGAKVLHPRCIGPVKRHGIPLHIYCLSRPEIDGTIISDDSNDSAAQVKSISAKKGITLVSMETIDMWHQVGFLAEVFTCFKNHGLSVDLVSTSETNVTVTLDRQENVLDEQTINSLKQDLENFCKVKIIDSCSLVSIVGKNIRAILHELGPALEVFEEHKIYLVSQAANDLNLTFVIDEDQAERLVGKLHEELIRQTGNEKLLGSSWNDTFERKNESKDEDGLNRWWLHKRDILIGLAKKKSPLYVYDEYTIGNCLKKLSSVKSTDRIFYSIKANPNKDVLKMIYDAGFGFECVSPGEVEHIRDLFPEIKKGRILFTPNFASREEYEAGFNLDAIVTLDNIFPLKAWPETFYEKEVFVRMDPGQGRGHHKFVKTAGAKSKFGVSVPQLDEFISLVKSNNIHVIGLHAHVGSNVFKTDSWSETAVFLAKVAERFPEVRFLDLGGGIGVVEKPGRNPFDFQLLDQHLAKFKKAYPQYELWLEPGRFVIAEAGVLLTSVNQIKQKEDYFYIGVNTGMNSLIRPALYGSHHEIINLSKPDGESKVVANIVGPICETGDVLGYERKIAYPEEGDILLIATTGAYGRVMSSSYNLREPAEEYFLKG